jgi:hypothetical protein
VTLCFITPIKEVCLNWQNFIGYRYRYGLRQKCGVVKLVNNIPPSPLVNWIYNSNTYINRTCTDLLPLKKTTCYNKPNDNINMDSTIVQGQWMFPVNWLLAVKVESVVFCLTPKAKKIITDNFNRFNISHLHKKKLMDFVGDQNK